MPLFNEPYWRERVGLSGGSVSGEGWLDWEHDGVLDAVFRKVMRPLSASTTRWSHQLRILDVGGGDGRLGAWMEQAYDVGVMTTTDLEWWPVASGATVVICDSESFDADVRVTRFAPDVVQFIDSLSMVEDWPTAARAARRLAPMVLCVDNFESPTPPYRRSMPARVPITWRALVSNFEMAGWKVRQSWTVDVMHRKLFLSTPKWSHPLVARVSLAIDLLAQRIVSPAGARHSAWLFVKGD